MTRLSEKELDGMESGEFAVPEEDIPRLVAEVRRLRLLLCVADDWANKASTISYLDMADVAMEVAAIRSEDRAQGEGKP